METFKINKKYRFWMDYVEKETSRRKAAGLSDESIQEAISDKLELAQKALAQDSDEWEAVTVLYSYNHGITGENMHFVRLDSSFVSARKFLSISEHKAITDMELQELKRCIV